MDLGSEFRCIQILVEGKGGVGKEDSVFSQY
jgi:hypothetical protein